MNEAAELIRANAHPESNIIFGAVIDPNMKDEIHLTVIATGFDKPEESPTLKYAQRGFEARSQQQPQQSRRSRRNNPLSSEYSAHI